MSHAQEGAQRASAVPLRGRPVHPRRVARILMTGLALAASLLPIVASTPVAARDASPAIRSTRPLPERVRPGRLVADHGIAARAPARGEFAFGIIERADGRSQSIYLRTTATGRVRAGQLGADVTPIPARLARAEGPSPALRLSATTATTSRPDCRDRARTLFPWRVVLLRWTLDPRGAPAALRDPDGGSDRLLRVLRRAQHNITWARNGCGRPDRVRSQGWFTTRTDRTAGVSSGGGCTGGDGQSTISFGSLPYPSVAMTCVYGVKRGVATEADIRINTNARWALALPGCAGAELLVEAAMTHEFGHVYGLGHTPSSQWQTMRPIIGYCDTSNATLGMGDLLGLEAKNR